MFDQLKRELDQAPAVTTAADLNMSNLLTFPPGIRQLVTWIMRLRVVHVSKVAEYLGQDEPNTQALMDLLIQKGLVEEDRSTGELHYQVPSVRSSRNYRVPTRVWKALDE